MLHNTYAGKIKMEKKNKKNIDLEMKRNAIENIIRKRYESDEQNSNGFIISIFLVSIILIIYGGFSKNIPSILSGTILLIFLYFALK